MNLEISKIDLQPEEIDDFRLQFGQRAPEALARDVVTTFADQDYAAQIQNDPNFFSYEKLQDGTATFFDVLSPNYTVTMDGEERPIRDLNPVQRSIFFKDPDSISALLTNAEKGSLSRAFFGELFKTAPSVTAGTKAAQLTAAQTFRTPPKSFPGFIARAAPVAASFIGGSLLLYEGADALEELAMGADKPILPGQKQAVEAMRTLGGATAGIQFPFLFKEAGNRVARDIIENLAEDAPVPTATKLTATIEEMLESMGKTARGTKGGAALTVGVESAAGAGSAGGAYVAEGMDPGGTSLRLGSEFLGGNLFGLAFAKMLPKGYAQLRETDADKEASDFLTKMSEGKKRKLFARIDELYTKYDGDYERMMNDLNSEETNKILQEVFPDVDFTAAQRLEDNTGIIMGLEAEMATKNPDLLAARKKAERDAKAFFDKFIYGLVEENTPESLRTAAILRKSLMDDMMSRRLVNAVDARISARNRVLTGDERSGTPQARKTFSLDLANLLETQLGFARKREKELWSQTGGVDVFTPAEVIDGDVVPSFITKYDEFLAELTGTDTTGYRGEFVNATKGLYDFVQDAKRRLGLDIKEGIAEQNAIIQSVDAQDSDPVALIRTKFEIPLADAPLNRQIDRMQNLINEIDKGRFVGQGEEIQTLNPETGETTTGQFSIDLKKGSDSQKNFLTVARAKLALLKLEQAKLDPSRVAPVSAKEMFSVRSEVLNDAAQVASGAVLRRGTANQARKLGEVAEAILDDLNRMPDGELDAFDIARAYSAALNDVYTRSIVGKGRSKDAMRGNRIPPELLINTFVKNSPDITDLRVHQLQGVAKFAEQQGFEGADSVFTSVNNIMEGAIRSLRLQAMNPDGSINAGALERYKRDNAELLELFPNLKADLDNAVSAQRTVETFEKRSAASKKISDSQAYLATLIGNSSPHLALTEALNFVPKNATQADPIGGLRRLFRLTSVQYKGPDGKFLPAAEQAAMREKINEGYFNTILQHAMMKAGGEGKTFDHVTFHRTLFEPLPGQGAGKRSLVDLAESYGIMDENQIRRIRTISNQMVRLAAADAAGKLNDPDLIKQAGPVFDFYVGMIGLAGGTKAYQALTGGTGGTASISAAGFTKGIALDFFKNIPASKRMEAIQMVFTDPEMAATLIRKPRNQKEGAAQANRIVKLLTEKGFLTFGEMSPFLIREAGEDEDVGTGRTEPLPTPQGMSVSSVAPTAMPAPQPVPAQPVAPPPTTTLASATPPPPPPPPPAASGPVDRRRFAAMFPEDRALVEGIGSLMG
jgi:hypothetical protein